MFSFRFALSVSKDILERAVLRRLLLDLRNNRDSIAALNKGQYMRIATARNEMKKPVRTVSIRDGKLSQRGREIPTVQLQKTRVTQSASRPLPYIPFFKVH